MKTPRKARPAHLPALGLLALLLAAPLPAVIVYEGFGSPVPYADNAFLAGGAGGQNWSDSWADGGPDFRAAAVGLAYLDLVTTPGGMVKDAGAGFGTIQRHFSESNLSSGTIYFSLLFQNGVGSNANDNVLILDEFTSGQERFRISNNGSGQLVVEVKTIGGSGSHVAAGTTSGLNVFSAPVLIVGSLTLGTANDTLTVWFNPSSLDDVAGTAAQTISLSEATVAGGGTFAGIATWRVDSTGRANRYDEFRLAFGAGASLADVVPVPEPAVAAAILGLGALAMGGARRGTRRKP